MAGDHNQNVPHIIDTILNVQLGMNIARKVHARQVTLVDTIIGDFPHVSGIDIP